MADPSLSQEPPIAERAAGRIDLRGGPEAASSPTSEVGQRDTGQNPSPESPTEGEQEGLRLRERYEEVAALAGGLAHEIRNPLSTIGMLLELMAEELAGAETPRDR